MMERVTEVDMSTQRKPQRAYTLDDYFAVEQNSELRHEFFNGEIFGMSGATLNHNTIVGNTFRRLGNALDTKGCRVFATDMRVRTTNNLYTYPDIAVVCGEVQLTDDDFDTLTNPVVLIEVLSKSTADYDRGDKFEMYQTIETLREYVLIDQYEMMVEHFSKDEGGAWAQVATYESAADELSLSSLNVNVPLAEIYRDAKL